MGELVVIQKLLPHRTLSNFTIKNYTLATIVSSYQLDSVFTPQKVDHYLKMLGQVTCMLVGMLKTPLALRAVSLL